MSARQDIQHWYGADAPRSLALLLDVFKAEVLREAAEKIRKHPGPLYTRDAAADLIDPDKENGANGTEADRA